MEAPMYGRGSAVTNEVNLTHSPPRARASAALRAAVLALRMAGVSVGLESGKVSSTWSVPTPATKPPTMPSGSNVRVTESASAARTSSWSVAVESDFLKGSCGRVRPGDLAHTFLYEDWAMRTFASWSMRSGSSSSTLATGTPLQMRSPMHLPPCNPLQWGHGLRPAAARPPRSPPPLSDLICAWRAATWDSAAASFSLSTPCEAISASNAACAAALASLARSALSWSRMPCIASVDALRPYVLPDCAASWRCMPICTRMFAPSVAPLAAIASRMYSSITVSGRCHWESLSNLFACSMPVLNLARLADVRSLRASGEYAFSRSARSAFVRTFLEFVSSDSMSDLIAAMPFLMSS